jgi:hypothetical protein
MSQGVCGSLHQYQNRMNHHMTTCTHPKVLINSCALQEKYQLHDRVELLGGVPHSQVGPQLPTLRWFTTCQESAGQIWSSAYPVIVL